MRSFEAIGAICLGCLLLVARVEFTQHLLDYYRKAGWGPVYDKPGVREGMQGITDLVGLGFIAGGFLWLFGVGR